MARERCYQAEFDIITHSHTHTTGHQDLSAKSEFWLEGGKLEDSRKGGEESQKR